MRKGLKTALTFTAGIVVGAAGWGGIQSHFIHEHFARMGWMSANETALHLQLLASDKNVRRWRNSLVESMPDLARSVNPHRDDPNYATVLWNIRLAYTLNEVPVPKEIEAMLSNLPSESAPQCPMPRRKLGLPPLPKQDEAKTSALNDPQL
jgi:hypothetical protein